MRTLNCIAFVFLSAPDIIKFQPPSCLVLLSEISLLSYKTIQRNEWSRWNVAWPPTWCLKTCQRNWKHRDLRVTTVWPPCRDMPEFPNLTKGWLPGPNSMNFRKTSKPPLKIPWFIIDSLMIQMCFFRHASVSSTYPCKSVGWLVRKSVSHTFGFQQISQ